MVDILNRIVNQPGRYKGAYLFCSVIMKQIDTEEGAKRQHRAVALFCVIQCWVRGLDGVVLSRADMERLLGLERFREARIDWIRRDFKEFFLFQQLDYEPCVNSEGYTKQNQEGFAKFTISRVPFDQNPKIQPFKLWKLPTPKQRRELYEAFIPFFANYANYDERFLTSYLTLLAQGQISPKSIPPLNTEE